jgi:hypothetical protein
VAERSIAPLDAGAQPCMSHGRQRVTDDHRDADHEEDGWKHAVKQA